MKMNPIHKKLKGVFAFHRDDFNLLKEKKLDAREFILYYLGIAVADWDESHTGIYETFKFTDAELAEILNCSDSTICRKRNSLIQKGFFAPTPNERIKVKDFERYKIRKALKSVKDRASPLQAPIAPMQDNTSPVQEQLAPMQENSSKERGAFQGKTVAPMQDKTSTSDVVSSKDYSKFNMDKKDKKQEVNNDASYWKIYEEEDYKRLTPEDMKWIDENINEI